MELSAHTRDIIPHLKDIQKGYPLFWFNPNHSRGYRLTERGYNILVDIGYKNWKFPYKNAHLIKSNEILFMDEKIMHPWYMKGASIVFFYETLAITMELTNFDIDSAINIVYS